MEDNNNLEKFFQQKFNQKIEPQDWNIPDNDIWDKIAREIPTEKRKKNRNLLIPIFLAFGFLGSSLFYAYDNYQKGEQIVQLQRDLKDCSRSSNENQSMQSIVPSTMSSVSADAKIINSASSEKDSNIGSSASVFNKNLIKTSPKKGDKMNTKVLESKDQDQNKVSSFIPDFLPLRADEAMDTELTSINPNLKISFPSGIKNRQLIEINSINSKGFIMIDKDPTFIRTIKESKGNLWLGVNTGYISWQDKEIGAFDNPLFELLVSEETTPSWSYGIQVNKSLGRRWTVNTGIQYYARNQKSIYAINLPYSTTQEIAVGSDYENRFQHSLPTGLGNINTSLVLARSNNSPVLDNENVYLDFSMKNEIRAMMVPLTFSYFPKEAGQGFFIQGGLSNELIIQNKISEITTESHHTYVKDRSIKVDYNSSQINKVNVSAIAGLGYQKTFSTGLGISLSANYGLALNNTFSSTNYQHKIDQINMQISVMKAWK
jgi:hypothetical protein